MNYAFLLHSGPFIFVESLTGLAKCNKGETGKEKKGTVQNR